MSDQLRKLRGAGITISVTVVKLAFLACQDSLAPQLAETKLKFSNQFVRDFLHRDLGWSHHAVTQAAQKTPADWETLCTNAFLRPVYWIKKYKVPAELVINADQTGVVILPAGKETWAGRGAKQVASVAKEEKRQYTLMVGSSTTGDMIPFQAIWSGKTDKSIPVPRVRAAAEKQGHRWVPRGERHWSTLATMKKVGPEQTIQECYVLIGAI